MTAVDATSGVLFEAPAPILFCSSSRLTILDHFRVPYELDPELRAGVLQQLQSTSGGGALLWNTDIDAPAIAFSVLSADRSVPIPLFTRVLADDAVDSLLRQRGGTWHPARELTSSDGAVVGSIWCREDGSVFLPFDPNEVIESFWTESYLGTASGRRAGHFERRSAPPTTACVRSCRGRCRSGCAADSPASRDVSTFPRWPVETLSA